jgi:hypothetical protein
MMSPEAFHKHIHLAIEQTRRTLDAMEEKLSVLRPESDRILPDGLHVRLIDASVGEKVTWELLLEDDDKQHHHFFAYHNGSAYPRG